MGQCTLCTLHSRVYHENMFFKKTLPEAQWTKGIESLALICFLFSCRDISTFRLYTLGPLCLWQCLQIGSTFGHQVTSLALLGSKVSHQVVSHALPHCLGMPYLQYLLVLHWYLHQPESHQLSLHKGGSVG